MKKVLFVCLGNICRSPMAEGLMRTYSEAQGVALLVDSAATSSWEVGRPPHPGTAKILREAGVDMSAMRARQVRPEDWRRFDYIIAMDKENLKDLQASAPDTYSAKVTTYLSVVPGKETQEVPDPWYTGDFNETRDLLQEGLPYWLAKFQEDES